MKSKSKNVEQKSRYYDISFKEQAVALAKEIGMKEAKEKLGLKDDKTLSKWTKASNEKNLETIQADLIALKEENKKLKRDLEKEKKVTAILRDATVFFCQDQQK